MSKKFLTAEQIRQQEEIEADSVGIEKTLRVALNFHSNAANELHKRRIDFWRELSAIHNLDVTRDYAIRYVDGQCEIVEIEGEDGR